MKNTFIFALLLTLVTACDVSEGMRDKSGQSPEVIKAREIAAKNGCMGCHTVTTSVGGPAWRLVADRYKDQPEAKQVIIDSINNGSTGRWIEVSRLKEMPGYQGKIPEEQLSLLADYILSL
ncbi:c-type cytochrome [Pseudomonadota bacterium]